MLEWVGVTAVNEDTQISVLFDWFPFHVPLRFFANDDDANDENRDSVYRWYEN